MARNVENTSIYGAKNIEVMTSQCVQKTRKGINESLRVLQLIGQLIKIMCNKQSALEYSI